jgi:chorismate mutase
VVVLTCFVICAFRNVWVLCMDGFLIHECLGNCLRVLVICILVFTAFCVVFYIHILVCY